MTAVPNHCCSKGSAPCLSNPLDQYGKA